MLKVVVTLISVSWYGQENLVQAALDRGVNVDVVDREGETALIKAATAGHGNIVKMLMKKGSDVNVKNNQGETALLKAVKAGNLKKTKNSYGTTLLWS